VSQDRAQAIAEAHGQATRGLSALAALAAAPLPYSAPQAPVGTPEAKPEPLKPEPTKPLPDLYGPCADFTLKYEGLYANHPNDPGGPTMRGVTIAVFRAWRRDNTLDIDDLKALTELEARQIFRTNYWNIVKGDDLQAGVNLCLFDFAVNSGPGRAAECVQEVIGFTGKDVDRAIGPKTLRAILAKNNVNTLIEDIINWRLDFLKGLKTWDTFGNGWQARVEKCRDLAHSMRLGKA